MSGWGRGLSAGLLSGLSASVMALSSGALLFDQRYPYGQGVAMAMMLITAVVGSLYGLRAQDKSVVASVEPGVVSVMATAIVIRAGQTESMLTHEVVLMVCLVTLLTGGALWLMARFHWGHLARYLPFPVMAGFMASTGWLIASGALDIAAGVPLNQRGFERLIEHPWHPELLLTLVAAGLLVVLMRRDRRGWIMPGVLITLTVLVHLLLSFDGCLGVTCAPETWLFSKVEAIHWLPPFLLDRNAFREIDGVQFLGILPVVIILVVMNILINFSSLEVSFGGEYDLDRELKRHAKGTLISALFGGFVPVISVSRTTLQKVLRGNRFSGGVAALFTLAVLFGASSLMAVLPRVVLGAVTLTLGLHLMHEWLWRQYRRLTRLDFLQILAMTVIVAVFGFIPGFVAGVILASLMFVKTYSETPLYTRMGDLRNHMSSVVRSDAHSQYLHEKGDRVRIYRLQGYLFFGSFYRFDRRLSKTPVETLDVIVIDFTRVMGIDSSARTALERIFRRYQKMSCKWVCVYNPVTRAMLEDLAKDPRLSEQIFFVPHLDRALEWAEEFILSGFPSTPIPVETACFGWLEDPVWIERFMSYCHIKKVEKGEELCLEGEPPNEIYFVGSGSLEVIRKTDDGEVRLARVNRGAMVGETAFFSRVARVATIRAATESQVFYLTADDFEKMRLDRPKLGNRFDHYVIRKLSHAQMRTDTWVAEWMLE